MRASSSSNSVLLAAPFVVKLREIPPEGLTRALDVPVELIARAFEGTEVDPARSHAHVELELQKSGVDVFVRGAMTGEVTMACSRCLAPTPIDLTTDYAVTFVPAGAAAAGSELVDADEDLEAGTPPESDLRPYTNEEIDLEETVREELLLALPIAPLCKESCKGLCSRCGADRNLGACGCPAESVEEHPFATLKNLKI